jgi:hypothetical protein
MSCTNWKRGRGAARSGRRGAAPAVLVVGLALAMSWRVGAAQPLDRPSADPPFASVLKAERVHLDEPMMMVVDGRTERERDLLLVIVRLAAPERFLPRGSMGEAVYLGNAQAQLLFPPIHSPVVGFVAPASEPLDRRLVLWSEPAPSPRSIARSISVEDRLEVARRVGPARFVPLQTAAQLERIGAAVVTIANREALTDYVQKSAVQLRDLR